jgi:hypothetical protein
VATTPAVATTVVATTPVAARAADLVSPKERAGGRSAARAFLIPLCRECLQSDLNRNIVGDIVVSDLLEERS